MNSETFPSTPLVAADAIPEHRAAFIRRTYMHVGGAIVGFTLIEALLFQAGIPQRMMEALEGSQYSWFVVLGAFMAVSWVAERLANSGASVELQYTGLGLYVTAEALIFAPLLWTAAAIGGPDTIASAALLTLLLFTGLTYAAITTRKDFSYLGSMLKVSCFIGLGVVAASIIFGFTLGLVFSLAMVAVAAGAILYHTSNMLVRYHETQYVAASLALFASVALMFWYVLRIFVGFSRRS